MCSQSVSGQGSIQSSTVTPLQTPAPTVVTGPVKGIVPMPTDASLLARLNTKPGLLSFTKSGGVPQSGNGTRSPRIGSDKVGSPTMTPEAKRLVRFKADYAKSMEGIGPLPAPDPKTAQTLMANAANAKGLLADFLFERRELLGDDFKGLDKEQFAGRLDRAPLARLSAADRMVVAELRSLHQNCLDRLNAMADTRDNAWLAETASDRIKKLDQYLKVATDVVNKVGTHGTDSDQAGALDQLLKQSLKGVAPDRTKTAEVFEKILKNLPMVPGLGRIPKTPEETEQHQLWSLRRACDKALDVVFTGIANLAGERALLQRGVSGPESTLRSLNLSRTSAWWAENRADFNVAIGLLHLCENDGSIPFPPEKQFSNLPNYKNFSQEFGDLGKFGAAGKNQALFPPAVVDRRVQMLLQQLMPAEVDKSTRKNAMRAAVWKFDQSLRFNARDRILLGLSANPGQQIRTYVKSTSLSFWQKKSLTKRLLAVLDQHLLRVPAGGKELTRGAQGAPRLVTLKKGEAPVLVKDILPGADNGPLLREMVMQEIGRGNPHIPKVLGIGVTRAGGAKGSPPRLSLVMEAIPGKSLNSYLHIGYVEEDAKTDSLLTGLKPADRGKVAAHLVAGGIRGLAPLHARGLAHMDVKPGNIMLDKNSLESRLIDFGSACVPGTFVMEKTSGYVPPDCFVASLASDVYALGVSLMQLAMGTITKEAPGVWAKNLDHAYWKDHPEAQPLRDAARIMMDPVGDKRPTVEQLLAILDGRPVPATEEGKGGASEEAIKILKKVFDPRSEWAGGRDVLAAGGKPTETGSVGGTSTPLQTPGSPKTEPGGTPEQKTDPVQGDKPVSSSGPPSPQHLAWENFTTIHPKGVCEAAVSLWLQGIGKDGVDKAQDLKPEDCDTLQGDIENDNWSYAAKLVKLLPKGNSTFSIDDAVCIKKPVETGTSSPPVKLPPLGEILGEMVPGKFYYVSANQATSGGSTDKVKTDVLAHAMGVYCEAPGKLRFFDPNSGFYSGSRDQIVATMADRIASWDVVTLIPGTIGTGK